MYQKLSLSLSLWLHANYLCEFLQVVWLHFTGVVNNVTVTYFHFSGLYIPKFIKIGSLLKELWEIEMPLLFEIQCTCRPYYMSKILNGVQAVTKAVPRLGRCRADVLRGLTQWCQIHHASLLLLRLPLNTNILADVPQIWSTSKCC